MTDAHDEQHDADGNTAKLMRMQRISLIIDFLLIAGCTYLLVNDFMKALTQTPEFTTRGGAFLVNLSATFALVYRSMVLTQRFWPAPGTRKWLVPGKWLLALLLPLFVAFNMERLVQSGHRAQLEALVAQISALTARAMSTSERVRDTDLRTLEGPYLQQLTVRADSGAFLLQAWIPALNVDGVEAMYSSTERVWHLQPKGSATETMALFNADGPTLKCRFQNQSLQCEHHER